MFAETFLSIFFLLFKYIVALFCAIFAGALAIGFIAFVVMLIIAGIAGLIGLFVK